MIGYWEDEADVSIQVARCGAGEISIAVHGRGVKTSAAVAKLHEGGSVLVRLKQALVDVESKAGLRFESFEIVDVARKFFGLAQEMGYRVDKIAEGLDGPIPTKNEQPVIQEAAS